MRTGRSAYTRGQRGCQDLRTPRVPVGQRTVGQRDMAAPPRVYYRPSDAGRPRACFAHYGANRVPADWRERLTISERTVAIADGLLELVAPGPGCRNWRVPVRTTIRLPLARPATDTLSLRVFDGLVRLALVDQRGPVVLGRASHTLSVERIF